MGSATLEERPGAEASPARPRRRRGRARKVAGALAAVVVTGAAAATAYGLDGLGGGAPGATPAAAAPPATAKITRETLRDTLDVDGELGFGPDNTVTGRRPGTITWLPAGGATVSRGRSLYRADNDPVVLMYGTMPAYRDLKPGAEGKDVRQLEENLRALGYDGFTVDDEYTWETAEAVEEWQDDRGLTETGVVELGRVVFAPGKVRVDAVHAEEGQPTGPGQKVLTYTRTSKMVTVRLDATEQRLAKTGAKVTVELPGGTRVNGRVTEVATVIEPGQGQGAEPETKIEALISIERQKAAAGLGAAAVEVTFTASTREDVLTVPVAALVALKEGGFGVEVVEGGRSRFVPVRTGLFSGGRVEVGGDGLAEGMTVGMPK
ncbi:efflux RND transporter periplasmic adaptor subunit [Bailinhaonella thermotolerans]|uniref:HlyD family efflux transporter periplasmic adaptor subunit n=1 Tax=Bailinhaonella thermotolerans TaxID=1070861 RepID=A0A3A4ASE9_9ACTN|nr:peptidoglycan-binding protein [Bailinhaonella thermotolerans]RJL31255.1 HlyD family efflux transporter periplasmic adaptor subunit [Bailinhaonella thermotolerans]